MTSYPAFTFPRKKRPVKEKVIPLTDEPEGERIYSTLSKKPADLKTTDIDLSAIRVFLVDGSHRTISCTPEATCREILDRLLGKLGLIEHSNEYALQIKYAFSEPRIADEGEQISELNVHVWDSVDRIYLCKKDIEKCSTPPLPRKKRVASFDRVVEQECSLSDNCAVTDKYMVEKETVHAREPVLVNEKLACRFARAWSVGSEKHQAGESGGQKPMTNAVVFKPVPMHFSEAEAEPKLSPKMERKNTYTLEHRPKDSTIRRRPPVSPRRMPESFTQQQETPKRSLRQLLKKAISQEDLTIDSSTLTPSHFSLHVPATPVFSPVSPRRTLTSLKEMPKRSPMRFPKRAKSQEDLMRERNTLTTSHSSLQLPTWQLPAISPRRTLGQSSLAFREPSEFPSPTREQPLLFQGDNKGEPKQSPNHRLPANDEDVAPAVQKESDKMPKFLVKTQSDGCLLSGIKSESDNNLCQTLSQEILRDSGFHDCHSSSGSLQSLQEATANISSLARFSHKAPLIRANSDNSPTTSDPRFTEDVSSGDTDLHASKSMELLTNADLETIRDIAMSAVDSPEEVSQNASSKPPPPIPPPIPERSCAYIHNCTIPDEDLLRQGKRISQMLQLTPKKEERERKPLRSLQAAFGRISTLLRKGNSSSHSSPSPTSGRKGLGFPDSPVLRRKETHPGDISPPKKPAEINSLGVRMSRVEYAEVNIWEKQNPSLDFSKSSTPPPAVARKPRAGTSPMTSPLSYDIATALSSSSGTRIGGRATTVSSRPLNTQNKKLSLSASDLTKDRGNALDDERQDFSNTVPHPKHQVLPKKRRTVIDEYDIAVPVKIPQREHRYLTVLIETPPPSPQHGKLPPSKYENNTLEMKSSSCIQLDGRDAHIYSTPKPKSMSHATPSTGACALVAKYENQGIQNGPSNGINFGNSPLHVYDAATPSSNSKLPPNKYENSALEMKSSSCSQLNGSDAQSSSSACGPMATYVYENQSIQNGPNSGINFGNSPLHVYQAVPPSSNSKLPSSKYENSALEMKSSSCIQLDGRDAPNPQSVSHAHTSNGAFGPVANYINQSIQNGPNSGINFGNSPLHVYDAAPPSSTSSHMSGSIPPPPPLPPKPATQNQARGPQTQQKSESSGSTQPLPPKPEVVGWSSSGRTTSESQKQTTSKDTSKLKKIPLLPPKPCTSSQDLPASSSSLPSPPYYQDNYSKLLWNVKKHPQDFTAPAPPQLISDVLLPADTNSGIYEPIPDLECAVDSGAPPPLPPLPLEMPVYSKLSFNEPLPPPPEPVLNTDSDSDLYDTIPSLPSSDDEEYDDIRLPARVPVTPEHSLPLKPKKWDQLWQQPTARVRDEEYDDIQLPARAPVTPEYSLPLKPKKFDLGPPKVPAKPKSCPPANPSASQKIVLTESSKSADGKTYKSWTSSNAIGNPREELQSKLKRRLNIIQAQLSNDDSSSPPSSSATQPESRPAWESNSEPARDGKERIWNKTPSSL